MSTVMYACRIKKKDFWDITDQLRQHIYNNHPAFKYAKIQRDRMKNDGISFSEANECFMEDMKIGMQADDTGLVALQLFDCKTTWLVRPLSFGWNFEPALDELKLPYKSVWYDGRVDEGSHHTSEGIADWMDHEINCRRYLIHVLLDTKEVFNTVIFGIHPPNISIPDDYGQKIK